MTRRSLVVAAVAFAIAIPSAFARSVQQQPVFRSRVDLVAVDVTVVDKDGKPVAGLKLDDFVITVNGKPGAVRELDYLTFGPAAGSEIAAAPREASNQMQAATQASRGGRVIVLLIDDLAAKVTEGKMLMMAAERLLGSLDMGDMVGLATTSGLGPALSPTRDRAAALAMLKSKAVLGRNEDLTQPFYVGVHEALEIDRGFPRSTLGYVLKRECGSEDEKSPCADQLRAAARRLGRDTIHRAAMQLRAYTGVINALRPAPAPRVVIALTTGVAPGADGDFAGLEPVSRAAAEAGVQFYAMTEVGDMIDMRDQGQSPADLPFEYTKAGARIAENRFLTAGVQVVAHAAGGEAFKVVGQADRFFKRIVSETSGVYRLGVEVPAVALKSRFLEVKASVKRSGVTVRAHKHAIQPSGTAAPVAIDDALRARLAQGGVAFGVPVALATAVRRDPAGAGALQLGVNVQMPGTVAAPLVAMYALVNDTGQVVSAGRQSVSTPSAGDYQLAFPISSAPGAYRLRFAVADAAGNIGSVEHRVDARLAQFGAVSVSDLVTTWTGTDDLRRFLALETVPGAATSMRAFIELYPADAAVPPTGLTVRFLLFREGESDAALEREVTPAPEGSVLSAGVDIPVTSLAAGRYTIRATVMESGAVIGTVTTSFRKAA